MLTCASTVSSVRVMSQGRSPDSGPKSPVTPAWQVKSRFVPKKSDAMRLTFRAGDRTGSAVSRDHSMAQVQIRRAGAHRGQPACAGDRGTDWRCISRARRLGVLLFLSPAGFGVSQPFAETVTDAAANVPHHRCEAVTSQSGSTRLLPFLLVQRPPNALRVANNGSWSKRVHRILSHPSFTSIPAMSA